MARLCTIGLKFCFFYVGFFALNAVADQRSSCWPQFTSTNTQLSFHETGKMNLNSMNLQGLYETDVEVVLFSKQGEEVVVEAHYKMPDGVYGLPFQFYALMVFKNGKLLSHEDYTQSCQAPGFHLFSGQSTELTRFKGVHDPRDNYQVLVWGR